MQAQSLMTQAVQLLILDKSAGRGGVTGWIAAHWKKSGRRQLTVAASRIRGRAAETARAAAGPVRLAAMLRIDLSVAGADRLSKELLPRLARALAKPKPLFAPRWTGEALLVAYQTTASAAAAAHAAAGALADAGGVRIAGHYASVRQADDVFSGTPFLAGPATRILERIVRSVAPGAIHLTEDFAAALHAGASNPHTEYIGDLDAEGLGDPIRLFALKS